MFDIDGITKRTAEAFDNPQVGDEFSEMAAYYIYVIHREGDSLVTMEARPPCTLPDDGIVTLHTVESFKKKYAYGTIPGYFVLLYKTGVDVGGWYTGLEQLARANPQ